MKRYYLFMFLLWGASSTIFAQQTEYEDWDGIFMEILPDTNNDNRYTEDNEIYKLWNTYKFNYQYVTKSGKELYYWNIPSWEWEFVSKENLSDDAITAFQMRIIPGACNGDVQSCIEFLYIMNTGDFAPRRETTGLIENEKNIWLHPPRSSLFKILELNPFPFIQKPYEKGNKWHWSLEIGSQWGDPRWKEWEGIIENQYTYEIVDVNSLIHTQLGELKCYKVDSYAESKLGKTYLTAYFNEIYGFVRLEYINIDGSTLNIELYSTNIK